MSATRPPKKIHVEKEESALRTDKTCPNCGRESAVVFPLIQDAVEPSEAKIVCLNCCPKGKPKDN